MRKSLGSKRNRMEDEHIRLLARTFGDVEAIDTVTLEALGLEKAPEQNPAVAAVRPTKKTRQKPSPVSSFTAPISVIAD